MYVILLLKFCHSIYISNENYSSIFDINNPKYTFVALVSDYCPHCKKVKPLVEELENTYNDSKDLTIGIIQCHYENKLCNKFPDSVTPSFYLVKGSIDGAEQYFGPINYSEITSYINKRILPSFVNIVSKDQFQIESELRNESSIFVLKNLKRNQMKEIKQIQKEFQHYSIFFMNISYDQNETKKPSLCNFYFPTNRMICLKKELTSTKMKKFIQKHLYPVVGPISQQLINNSKQIKSTILILYDEYPFFEKIFRNMSSLLPDDLISATLMCANNYDLCLKLIIQTGKGPKMLMYNPYKKLIWYYRGQLDEEQILYWIKQVMEKKVRPTGPGSGFIGFIGNMFDISIEGGYIGIFFLVNIITIFVFMLVCGTANSIHRKGKIYHKID